MLVTHLKSKPPALPFHYTFTSSQLRPLAEARTASQTAWALLGLMAAGYMDHPAVRRGIEYLVETQTAEGTWEEDEFTGTGFPQVFYLKYHYYPIYFPLLAMAQWQKAQGSKAHGNTPEAKSLAGNSGHVTSHSSASVHPR